MNSWQALLRRFDHTDCSHIYKEVFYHAANDIASGLQFLHENGNFYKDLKPANILVSNQHYSHFNDPEKNEEESSRAPLICKFTDFGESRSYEISINTVISRST